MRLLEIARIRRTCSRAEGTSYSTYFMKERIAVKRRFRVRAVFAPSRSRCSKKSRAMGASRSSRASCDGDFPRRPLT